MSVQIIMSRDVYLDNAVTPITLANPLYAGDAQAQRIRFRCFQKHGQTVPMDLTGTTITAHFIRPDDGDVVITGTAGSEWSYVDLPQACYAYKGLFKLLIRAINGDVTTSILYVTGRIDEVTTDTIIDPGHVIPSLEELLAKIEDCEDATQAANTAADGADAAAVNANAAVSYVASAYDATLTYSAGEYAIQGGKLYRCLTDIETAEAWTPEHWTEVVFGEELSNLKQALDEVREHTKNLLDPSNALSLYVDTSNNFKYADTAKGVWIKCEPNTTYSISRTPGTRFCAVYSTVFPEDGNSTSGRKNNYEGATITITTGADAEYLYVWLYNSTSDTETTFEEVLDSVQIEIGAIRTVYEPPFSAVDLDARKSVSNALNASLDSITTSTEWAQGSINAQTGSNATSTTRIRSKYVFDKYVLGAELVTGYAALIYAYQQDGTYVGNWNGTEFIQSTTGNAWFEGRIIFDEINPAYSYKLAVKRTDGQEITPAEYEGVKLVVSIGKVAEMSGLCFRGIISTAVDLDDYKSNLVGFYLLSYGAKPLHDPVGSSSRRGFFVFSSGANDSLFVTGQVMVSFTTGRIYTRFFADNTWSEWTSVDNPGNASYSIEGSTAVNVRYPLHDAGGDPYTKEPKVVTLLHFSDVHEDAKSFDALMNWANKRTSYYDNIICTGDIVNWYDETSGSGTDDYMDFWKAVKNAEKILVTVGNHDVKDEEVSGKTNYLRKAIARSRELYMYGIDSWGVTSPTGKTWWYKDYSNLRLIGLDTTVIAGSTNDTDQQTWFESALSAARTQGLSVVVAQHYAPDKVALVSCDFTATNRTPLVQSYFLMPNGYQAKVQAFIDAGGEFICWLAGHQHLDFVTYNTDYPDQMFFVVTSLWNDLRTSDQARTEGTPSEVAANLIGFDVEQKLIKVSRLGANSDYNLRSREYLVYNYATKTVVRQASGV